MQHEIAEFLKQTFRGLFHAFTQENFAWDVGAWMTIAFLAIFVFGLLWSFTRYLVGLRPAVEITRRALGSAKDVNTRRFNFAKSFDKVSANLSKTGFGREALSIGWMEFQESLFDTRLKTAQSEIHAKQNSIRPIEFFTGAVHPPRFLGFFANIFVGFGLLLTFVGLVAALGNASNALHDNGAETTNALIELITTASNKFVTSVFGVGFSLLLKLEERILTQIEVSGISRLCVNIERGLKFVSPQSLADETLFEARQQSASLRVMGETVASHIGEKLNMAMTPLADAVTELRKAFEEGAEEQARSLREAAGTAVSDATGAELRALAQHLATLGETMSGLEKKIQDSGSVASAQIANAAGELREALSSLPAALTKASDSGAESFARLNVEAQNQMRNLLGEVSASIIANNERMNEALNKLPSIVSEVSDSAARSFASVNDQAQRQHATFFSEAQRRFLESSDQLEAMTSAQSQKITEISEKAGARLLETISQAAGNLEQTVESLGAKFSVLPGQLTSAAEESRKLMADSAESTVRQLAETQSKISATVALIAGLKPVIEGWQAGAEKTATGLTMLVEASTRNQRAAEELTRTLDQRSKEAAQQLSDVAGGITQSAQAGADALAQAQSLHESITNSHQALMSAWESHRLRFESVDDDLGRAAQLLNQAVEQFAEKVATQINEMDRGLAKNIGGLKDATEELVELIDELSRSTAKAAE